MRELERCPECGHGYIVPTASCGNPTAVQYVCSVRCGWNA